MELESVTKQEGSQRRDQPRVGRDFSGDVSAPVVNSGPILTECCNLRDPPKWLPRRPVLLLCKHVLAAIVAFFLFPTHK